MRSFSGCCSPTKSCHPHRRLLRGSASRAGSATVKDSRCLSAPGCCLARLTQTCPLVVLSFVGRRVVEAVVGHPRLPCSGTGVPWVSLPGPTGVPQSPGRLCGKAPTLVVCLLVLLESRRRVCLALVFVVVHHAHVQLRMLTPLLDWKRCPSSQSSPFSVLRIISTKFSAVCGCSLQLVILFDTFFISFEFFSCLL